MSGNARLNWAEARDRLLRVQQTIEETSNDSGARRDQIYRTRAELLARPVSHHEDSVGERIMVVRIGAVRYGITLPEISEVIGGSTCAPVPGAPPEVTGLIQIGGEVRPVLNAGRILGVPGDNSADSNCILLLRWGAREIGVQVDEVEDIRTVRHEERKPPFPGAAHARWMTDDFVTVLDISSLLEEHTEVS